MGRDRSIIVESSNFPKNKLPSNKNIIQKITFERSSKNNISDSIKIASKDLTDLWERAALPIVSPKAVHDKIKRYYEMYYKLTLADKKRSTVPLKIAECKVRIF